MRYAARLTVLCGLTVANSKPAAAGAVVPCVTSTSSADKNILVLSHINTGLIGQTSFSILAQDDLIRANNKVTLPATYWDRTLWTVSLDAGDPVDLAFTSFCALPLITDDGGVLVLLSSGPGYLNGPALRIYRRPRHQGDPVGPGKDISLKDLWPLDKKSSFYNSDSDMHEWFAGGTFAFSADSRELIHVTRWGNTVHINLREGSIQK